MKALIVLLLTVSIIGCGGYGSNSMGGGSAPHLTSLNPSSTTAPGSAFALTITGTGLSSGSTVYWSMTAMAPTNSNYSGTSLTVNISAAQVANSVASPGVPVYVHTSAGNSNTLYFMVN